MDWSIRWGGGTKSLLPSLFSFFFLKSAFFPGVFIHSVMLLLLLPSLAPPEPAKRGLIRRVGRGREG